MQLLTLSDTDMNQILNHMGHTWDVHRDFYRQYDSVGERLDVAKLIMLQDQNKLNEYRDKSLAGIDVERLAEAQFKGKECAEYVCICRTVENEPNRRPRIRQGPSAYPGVDWEITCSTCGAWLPAKILEEE